MTQHRNLVRNTVRHPRQPMALHQNVLLQDRDTKLWCIKGKVMAVITSGWSYIIKTSLIEMNNRVNFSGVGLRSVLI